MRGLYKIAGIPIEIYSLHKEVHDMCRGYETEEDPRYRVETTDEDIAFEREKSAKENEAEGLPQRNYPDGYLETLAVYRKIADAFAKEDILLFHGSAIAVDGIAYLFTAKSGTGKSTHSRLWRQKFGERAVMINDDKPLLKITPDGVSVYGTPWNGKHHLSENIAVPLHAVCILTRAEQNHIEPITPKEAYPMLLQQAYRSRSSENVLRTLSMIDRMMKTVRFFRLGCNMDPEAADVAYDGMNKTL